MDTFLSSRNRKVWTKQTGFWPPWKMLHPPTFRPLLFLTTLWMPNGLNDALMIIIIQQAGIQVHGTSWSPSPWCRRGPKTGQSWDTLFNVQNQHPEIASWLWSTWSCFCHNNPEILMLLRQKEFGHVWCKDIKSSKPETWLAYTELTSLRFLDPQILRSHCLYHPKWWNMIQNDPKWSKMDVKIHPFSVFTAMAEPDVFDPYEVLGVSGDATLEDTIPAKSVGFSCESIDSTSIIINHLKSRSFIMSRFTSSHDSHDLSSFSWVSLKSSLASRFATRRLIGCTNVWLYSISQTRLAEVGGRSFWWRVNEALRNSHPRI